MKSIGVGLFTFHLSLFTILLALQQPSNVEPLRLPPHNHEAEQAVLSGILIDTEAIGRVIEVIGADDFYRETHRKIFRSMIGLYERSQPTDLLVVCEELRKKGELEEVGGSSYLSTLVDHLPSSANLITYARIIKEKAILRGLIEAATEIISKGFQQVDRSRPFPRPGRADIFQVPEKRIRVLLSCQRHRERFVQGHRTAL